MIEQLGLIAAILGGFAFTFLGAILSKDDNRKIVDWIFIIGVISALIFFICAIGWSFLLIEFSNEVEGVSIIAKEKHRFLSIMFITGILTLSICLGISGWIRSKKIGAITTLLSLIGVILIIYLINDYLN